MMTIEIIGMSAFDPKLRVLNSRARVVGVRIK
jgi:hypothetical protein